MTTRKNTDHYDQISAAEHVGMAVFFSRGMSLEAWSHAGILEREMALYRQLSAKMGRVCFVTYGGENDKDYCPHLCSIEVLPNRWSLPANVYSILAPWLHRASLRNVSIYKTNQINGGWTALVARTLLGGKLLVRCGYVWSEFVVRLGAGAVRRTVSTKIERLLFNAADEIIVSSEADARQIEQQHGPALSTITTICNYVDLDRFRPKPSVTKQRGALIFVGRLEDQKNPSSLLDALVGLDHVQLMIVGDGSLRVTLEKQASRLNLDVKFLGTIDNGKLPELLNRCEAFVFPSRYEGTPKALLEAMACGVPVIAARSPGITEVVTHDQTGYLCGISALEIRAAISTVLKDPALRDRLGRDGARYVKDHHALMTAVDQELTIVTRLCPAVEAYG